MRRTLLPLAMGLLMALGSVSMVAAAAGGGSSFSVSPTNVSITVPVYNVGYADVTVTTGKRAIVLASPSVATGGLFFDSQNGTCWQQYLSIGQKIPMKTSCTVRVGFTSANPGTYAGTLSVAECLKWHLDGSGAVACDKSDTPQSVALAGTATWGIADLIVIGVVVGNAGPQGDADYRVDVVNQGDAPVLAGVQVDGWWSQDTILDANDQPACSGYTTVDLIPGGVTPVFITCPNKPSQADEYVVVELDHGNLVEESDESNNVGFGVLPPH